MNTVVVITKSEYHAKQNDWNLIHGKNSHLLDNIPLRHYVLISRKGTWVQGSRYLLDAFVVLCLLLDATYYTIPIKYIFPSQ